jgi:hypothetical protein
VIAVGATIAAQISMGASWRIGVDETERTTLVTTGPFRLVRNPIFTAAVGVMAGVAIAVPNAIALVGLGAAIIGLQLQVRRIEEPYLLRVHGEDYRAYAAPSRPVRAGGSAGSRRLIPTNRKTNARPGQGTTSTRSYTQHHGEIDGHRMVPYPAQSPTVTLPCYQTAE